MAHVTQDGLNDQPNTSENINNIDASGQSSIEVPSSDFIADVQMHREGQDLFLESSEGDTIVINNYFIADPAPLIESPDGSILTSNLVNSFLNTPSQFAQASTMADESPVGAIEELSGEATVIRSDGTSENLTLGTPIFQGDVIETSNDGAVNIVFIDETSMAVSQNARLAIDEYDFDPATESGETNLSVLKGVFVFTSGLIGRDDPDDVQIDTPVGSIGIRGTIIAGNIQPGGESEITVMEGAIVVTNGAMETTLSQQYETVKLSSYNDNMQEMGVKNSQDMDKSYGSVSDVVPKLFSSINDTAKEEATQQGNEKAAAEENSAEGIIQENEEIKAEEMQEEVLQENNPEGNIDTTIETIKTDNFEESSRSNKTDKNPENKKFLRNFSEEKGAEEHFVLTKNTKNDNESRINLLQKPVFENSSEGTVVAEVTLIGNIPAGTTFALSDTTNYTYIQNGNTIEIQLTATGSANSDIAPGSSLAGSVAFIATLPNGNTVIENFEPIIFDAQVKLNENGGLNYDVHQTSTPITPEEKFDFNNDGHQDTLTGDQDANFGKGSISLNGNIINNPSGTSDDHFGQSTASIGDFDGDGKDDFIVGAPDNYNGTGLGKGSAFIYTGDSSFIQIRDNSGAFNKFGTYVKGIGDTNNDGLSDVMIGTDGNHNKAYVVFGGATSDLNTDSLGANGFKIDTGPNKILSGDFVGDINGDGFDDFAISLKMGSDVNTFIINGSDTFPPVVDMTYLENPDNALKINHAGVGNATDVTDYTATSAGDVNGDGFDDVQVGISGESQFIVQGQAGRSDTITDGSENDGDSASGIIRATATEQSLAGDVDFHDNGNTGISMKGGSGDNEFTLLNQNFKKIDGGLGQDTINFEGTSLDFTSVDVKFEQISGIEKIQLNGSGSTMTLNTDQIFNLLKASDDGNLVIELGNSGSGTQLNIENDTGATLTGATHFEKIREALDANGDGDKANGDATYHGLNGDGNHHYEIGDYNLYIQNDATNLGVAVV